MVSLCLIQIYPVVDGTEDIKSSDTNFTEVIIDRGFPDIPCLEEMRNMALMTNKGDSNNICLAYEARDFDTISSRWPRSEGVPGL